ncbi:MAG: FHA domain-containing protein [Planctomycetota bacterium]
MPDLVACPKCRYKNKPDRLACGMCGEVLVPKAHEPAEAPAPADGGEPASAPAPARKPVGAAFLVCSPYPPFRLPDDREITIGRENDNDFVLPAKIVSRTHASVYWAGDGWAIRDRGSSNGTFLNDHPVETAYVKHGDHLKIGTFELQFHESPDGSIPSPKLPESGEDSDKRERTVAVELNPAFRTGISGHLKDMSLPQLLQSLEAEKKTGTLLLSVPTGVLRPDGHLEFLEKWDEAEIGFKGGRIVASKFGTKQDAESIFTIFQRAKGAFRFDPKRVPAIPTFSFTVQEVLLEHMRRLDEAAKK